VVPSAAPLRDPYVNSPAKLLAYVPCRLHQGNLGNAAARGATCGLAISVTLHSGAVQRHWPVELAHV